MDVTEVVCPLCHGRARVPEQQAYQYREVATEQPVLEYRLVRLTEALRQVENKQKVRTVERAREIAAEAIRAFSW